ncbi:hypothetical protein MPTK1_4g23420 [Marchantia polymorpha subsp. ruderalis]|uniref:Uncharacterized protein n=2 Tax=Marchantia polymorpha TaxID=3197 RepID=A0AAF6BCY9_MARPO|nr:hypothetical protein MARPO_0020s0105 [Marchantia polymorpha]BBN09873.1 hypothetical protein Mp_4g23420 [Marchantia polymorpha subsp. ruderalis]|eukprot:PTQ44450.1 hypothetical protein MARPO_0020s0105 [Marchantia polymorpha]
MGVIISLPIGIARTVVGALQKFVLRQNKPLRIDIPLPFIPIDVVLVTDAAQIMTLTNHPDVDHLHALPTDKLPFWSTWFFSGTRFHNKSHDKWFLAFEPQSEAAQYSERRKVFEDKLSSGFAGEDVKSLADQIASGASEEQVAVSLAQIVDARFMKSELNSIPVEVVRETRHVLPTNLVAALVPGNQKRGVQAQEATYSFCQKNAQPGLDVMDVTHNVGSVVTIMAVAVLKLKDNLDTPIEHLFTRKSNCPTPQVPRVVMRETNLNGLLRYPGRPSSTIVMLSISSAAEQANSLFFTFGTGTEWRACPFKDFFFNFMTALQAELKTRRQS